MFPKKEPGGSTRDALVGRGEVQVEATGGGQVERVALGATRNDKGKCSASDGQRSDARRKAARHKQRRKRAKNGTQGT